MSLTPEQFISMLRSAPQKLSEVDLTEPLTAASEVIYESVGRNFSRQVDETGSHWPPRRDKLPHPLLLLTLAMSTAATGGPGSIRVVGKKSLKLGIDSSKVHYWRKHQDGDGVPRRRYFFLHVDERGSVIKVFGDASKPIVLKQVFGRG